jgi:hypothetical protein
VPGSADGRMVIVLVDDSVGGVLLAKDAMKEAALSRPGVSKRRMRLPRQRWHPTAVGKEAASCNTGRFACSSS